MGPFAKYHGNGNDFIIFAQQEKALPLSIYQNYAPALCDRHKGIGADGILVLTQTFYGLDLKVINQDATIAYNCGNGLRCAARWYFDSSLNKEEKYMQISLGSNFYNCSRVDEQIFVEMGEAQLKYDGEVYFKSCDKLAKYYSANLGNKHKIFIFDSLYSYYSYGDKLVAETQDYLVNWQEYNLGFVFREGENYYSWVFERGVGFTQSCGSGACVAAAALSMGHSQDYQHELLVRQPGGLIWVNVRVLENNTDYARFMLGQKADARAVFCGNLMRL